MKLKRFPYGGTIVFALAACNGSGYVGHAQTSQASQGFNIPFIPGEVLIQFRGSTTAAQHRSAHAMIGALPREVIHRNRPAGRGVAADNADNNDGDLILSSLPSGMSVEAAIQWLRANPVVTFAEPNYIATIDAVSNDTHYTDSTLWGIYSNDSPSKIGPSGTTNTYGIQAEKPWAAGHVGSKSIYVGVVDQGIQITHPDLKPNIWVNPFDPRNGVDDDGNGYIDDTNGWDFVNNNPTVYDRATSTDDTHGTHVAGTIGARGGNGLGVAGVNWNVTLIATKFVAQDGSGKYSNAIKAWDYLTDLKARHGLKIVAINNSWGGTESSQALLDAAVRAAKKNILLVAAAGNNAGNNDATPQYPANLNTASKAGYDAVIAVAAIDSAGKLASFSNFGASTVDLGAPGVFIRSTYPGNSYAYYSGTSMAAPHVTGAAALYASTHSSATALQIKNAILNNGTATPSLSKTRTGKRLNVTGF